MIEDPRIKNEVFRFLEKHSADLLIILSDAGKVLWANRSAKYLLGDTLIDKQFGDIVKDQQFVQKIEDSSVRTGRERMITINGHLDSAQSYYFSFKKIDESVVVFGRLDADELESSRKKMFVLNNELNNLSRELHKKNAELQNALDQIKTLEGILPICSFCHKIRNDKEVWDQLEMYIERQTSAQFSHSICPDCLEKHYPEDPDEPDDY